MTTKPFRRYWAMTPDGLGLCVDHRLDQQLLRTARVQFGNEVKDYFRIAIRPATFSEYCWRDDGFAGTHYGLFFTVFAACIALTIGGILGGILGSFPELWGQITCILAGPVIMGTWVGATWMNFKRYWV